MCRVRGGSATPLVNQTRVDFAVPTYRFISIRPWGRGGNGEVFYDIVVVCAHCCQHRSECSSEILIPPVPGLDRNGSHDPISPILGVMAAASCGTFRSHVGLVATTVGASELQEKKRGMSFSRWPVSERQMTSLIRRRTALRPSHSNHEFTQSRPHSCT